MKKTGKFVFAAVAVAIILLAAAVWHQTAPFRQAQKLLDAIDSRDAALVSQLLRDGVDPNQTDIPPSSAWSAIEVSPRRPLAVAAAQGDPEIVRLLIEYGATAETIENTGWSPLRCVLFCYDPDDAEIVQLLLENGADPKIVEAGRNSIFAAADMRPYLPQDADTQAYNAEAAQQITRIVQLLLADGAADMRAENGMTLLMYAARRGNLPLAQYLLEIGCDPALTDRQGKTAYDYAETEDLLTLLSQTETGR